MPVVAKVDGRKVKGYCVIITGIREGQVIIFFEKVTLTSLLADVKLEEIDYAYLERVLAQSL